MLPFLKDKNEGGMSGPVESKQRTPDEGKEEDYGMLDAIVDDLLDAVHKKDKKLLKSSLEALIEVIQAEDEIQDQENFE